MGLLEELWRETQVMLFQWHGFVSVLVWAGVLFLIHGTFWSSIRESDVGKIWLGQYEMRGGRRVKVGWGKPLDREEP